MTAISSSPFVYIYSNENFANLTCVEHMCEKLEGYGVSSSKIITLPDESYLHQALKDKMASLIFPGGHTTVLLKSLKDKVHAIRKAVDEGWSFLGTCAGGNYACNSMSLSHPKRGPIEDFGKELDGKFLQLLPIHAHAPAYPVETLGGSMNNMRIITVITEPSKEEFAVVWNEGSIFTPLSYAEGLRVEAVYADVVNNPACTYSGTFGRGNVVITAVHPELFVESSSNKEDSINQLLIRLFQLTVFSELNEIN